MPRVSLVFLAALVTVSASIARADPTPEQLKASFDETVRQLQQSQDRKNQLANENEQLKARVAGLESKLAAIDAQARQTEFLRGQFVAWSSFLERYPLLLKRFRSLSPTSEDAATVRPPEPFLDPEWPFSAAGRMEEAASTQPVVAEAKTIAAQTTTPLLVSMFHGGPNHWCALCAAAAARKAEADRSTGEPTFTPPAADLMQDLPPR